jgi:hypothetical protein
MLNSNNDDLADKIYSLIKEFLRVKSRRLSQSVKQLNQETVFVDMLQWLVDRGNLDIPQFIQNPIRNGRIC